jgi:hypothetical protein
MTSFKTRRDADTRHYSQPQTVPSGLRSKGYVLHYTSLEEQIPLDVSTFPNRNTLQKLQAAKEYPNGKKRVASYILHMVHTMGSLTLSSK